MSWRVAIPLSSGINSNRECDSTRTRPSIVRGKSITEATCRDMAEVSSSGNGSTLEEVKDQQMIATTSLNWRCGPRWQQILADDSAGRLCIAACLTVR